MIRPTDNRLRLVYVPEHQVLDWFARAANSWASYYKHGSLLLPMIDGLPTDVSVVAVHHDYQRRAFQFTIGSMSFSEHIPGTEIPIWEDSAPIRYETVELRTDADRWRFKEEVKRLERQTNTFIAGEDIPKGPRFLQIKSDGKLYLTRDTDRLTADPVAQDELWEGGVPAQEDDECDQPTVIQGEA